MTAPMRQRFLIVKTGDTLAGVVRRGGDFEDWIREGLGVPEGDVVVADPRAGAPLPPPADFCGLLLTGSPAMVTDRAPWSERTAAWLRDAVGAGVPVLGICYGHQLLAHALGGAVAKNPRGREIGTIEARLEPAAAQDPLFAELAAEQRPLRVQATHQEAVVALPPGARLLASSDRDPHHAFVVGERAYGVQFHPEFDAQTIRDYLGARARDLRAEGLDAEGLAARAADHPDGTRLLGRFAALCRAR